MATSPLASGEAGLTDTVRVTASEAGALRDAVTLALPPFSPMEDELRARVTVGVSSSSVMVRVTGAGSFAPTALAAAPDMKTVLSGESRPLLMALRVSAAALVVAPGGIVSVVPARA